jgi:hypothetical protein
MKSLKIAGYVVGGLLVLGLAAVALALNSGVQSWAVRWALAGQPGMTIEFARLEAGLSKATVSDLRFVREGLTLTAKSISARYSAWAYLFGSRIEVDELAVQDLLIDQRTPTPNLPAASAKGARHGSPSPARTTSAASSPAHQSARPAVGDGAKPPFEGLLRQLALPVDLRLGSLSLKGRALLPQQQQAAFALKGSEISAGQRGRLEWTIDFSDATPEAPVRAVRSTGTLQAQIAGDRRFSLVELDTTSSAMGPNLPLDQFKIAARVAQVAGSRDEDYSVEIQLLRANKSEPLIKSTAKFVAARQEFAGTWEIALRSDQLAALLSGLGFPEIAATGTGKFSVQPAAGAIAASGTLRASVSQLQKLSPVFTSVGPVQISASFDGAIADSAAHLNSYSTEIADAAGRRFLQANLLQKVTYRLADRHITFADAKSEAARLVLQAVPLAWAQPLAKGIVLESGDLSLGLALEAEPDGSRVRARALEPLTLRNVTIRDSAKKALVENVTLTTRPSLDYATTRLHAQLADLKLAMTTGDSLAGTLSAEITNLATKPSTAFRAQLQAALVTLAKPFLAFDPGTLAATIEAEGRHEGDSLHLEKTRLNLTRGGGALLVAAELAQPIRADLKSSTFAAASPAATAARLRVGEIPLAWLEPYIAQSKITGTLAGAVLEVTMRSPEDLTALTPEPFVLRGVTAALGGKALVQSVDLSASLTATKRRDSLAYELRQLELKQGSTPLARISATGETGLAAKGATTAKGSLEADVAALMAQPFLAPFATLNRGRLTTSFEGTFGETTQAKATFSARNLVAKTGNQPLGDVDLSLSGTFKPDGSGTITAPLAIAAAGRKSDLLFDGTFGRASDKSSLLFTGRVSSTNLVVDDLQALAALAPAGEPAKSTAPTQTPAPASGTRRPGSTAPVKPARDSAPFWQGVYGRAEVDLKRLLYGKDYTIRAIRGSATVAPTRLALENLEGSFRDRPFKLASTVTFAPAQALPYSLNGVIDVSGVDLGEVLRAANPKEKPVLESTMRVAARLNGQGGTLPDLIGRTYGTFDLSGGKGVLRALGRKGEAVGTASALLGIAGALAGSGNTVALGRLGQELEEMQFESFTLKVERDAALNMKFTAIEFLSPNKRLTGTGSLNYVAGASFEQWPFQFEFRLAGKDFMAQLLNEARVLSGNQDEKGFYPMAVTFPVSGTAANVNNGLWKILAGTAARAGLESLLRR